MNQLTLARLLFTCFLFAWPNAAVGNEADRLLALIKSQTTVGSRRDDLLDSIKAEENAHGSIYIGPQDGLREADKIDALPGQPKGSGFDQYAGYVTVEPTAGRALFYYFAEAPQPSDKPLVLWLNGGPGCSSLGGGGLLELGPFFVNSDGKTLYKNAYAWNNVANMIFLEAPAGVGFSYSNTTSDYSKTGDKMTTDDTYTFLVNWLERFPQYKGRDFFITGESYAGHYIPELANTIIARNKLPNTTIINLKRISIGNAYVDDDTNNKGMYNYFWTHALISNETYYAIEANCSFANQNYTDACLDAFRLANSEVGQLDFYNVYAPLCHDSSKSSRSNGPITVGDPCSDVYVNNYLNLADVQRALHANTTGLNYTWSDCSNLIRPDNWNEAPITMLPAIKQIIASGISVWLYSGDVDSVVPVTSTQYSLDILRLPIETAWHPWYTNDEIAGYIVGYKGLVFVTVRGAGHMVPRYQPERALTLFSSFLQGKLPPRTTTHKTDAL